MHADSPRNRSRGGTQTLPALLSPLARPPRPSVGETASAAVRESSLARSLARSQRKVEINRTPPRSLARRRRTTKATTKLKEAELKLDRSIEWGPFRRR